MHKPRLIGLWLLLASLGLTACSTTSGEPEPAIESEGDALDRGFDPCLVNNQLPVCTENDEQS